MNIIKELRLKMGISQQKLADILFVNQTAVSQWERGTSKPSSEMLIKLSYIFNVSTDCLLGADSHLAHDSLEIMAAVEENKQIPFDTLISFYNSGTSEEKKALFDILVELNSLCRTSELTEKKKGALLSTLALCIFKTRSFACSADRLLTDEQSLESAAALAVRQYSKALDELLEAYKSLPGDDE